MPAATLPAACTVSTRRPVSAPRLSAAVCREQLDRGAAQLSTSLRVLPAPARRSEDARGSTSVPAAVPPRGSRHVIQARECRVSTALPCLGERCRPGPRRDPLPASVSASVQRGARVSDDRVSTRLADLAAAVPDVHRREPLRSLSRATCPRLVIARSRQDRW